MTIPAHLENNSSSRDEWKRIDFSQIKKAQFSNLNAQLHVINQQQKEHRAGTTQTELEQVEYLQNENVALQRVLAKTIEGKRVVMADIGRENMDFQVKYAARVNEKDSLR